MVEEPPATRLNRLADATVTRKGQVQRGIVRAPQHERVAHALQQGHGSVKRQGTMRGDRR
jgi:hypothetical protein